MPQGVFDSNDPFTPALTATGSDGATAVIASSDATAVDATGNVGVSGYSNQLNGIGVFGQGGVPGSTGVRGFSSDNAGVQGESINGPGIIAQSTNGIGLHAVGGGASSTTSPISQLAIQADGGPGTAIFAVCNSGFCVYVYSDGAGADGIFAGAPFGTGVSGSGGQYGVRGESTGGVGVQGTSSGGLAGRFLGDVQIQGTLTKSAGGFKIDHPLDPENKYLLHAFVESPDMLNIYNGNVTTDGNGDATIRLPAYFEALNHDFRYQLTVIGQFAQAIVAEEVRSNQFEIKTDQPNVRVSWQVTGIRKDHFANTHRILVEEEKPVNERGMYLHPEAHGKPETQGIRYQHENMYQHEKQL